MKASILTVALVALGSAGCGPSAATLKGKVVDGDKPFSTDGQLVSLQFHPMKPDGTADATNAYTANVGGDGAFEFVASGGTLPPGKYRVVISGVTGGREGGGPGPEGFAKAGKGDKKKADRFAPHNTLATSKLTVTVTAGANDRTVDLSKPGG